MFSLQRLHRCDVFSPVSLLIGPDLKIVIISVIIGVDIFLVAVTVAVITVDLLQPPASKAVKLHFCTFPQGGTAAAIH